MEQRESAVITITLANAGGREIQLHLPVEEWTLHQARERLAIDEFTEATIVDVTFHQAYLSDLVPLECIHVGEANDLAMCIEEMQQTDGELLKYLAVLSVEQPETMKGALQLAMDLDDYERITEGTYEYGQSVLRRRGADQELLEMLEGYTDFEKLGEDAMIEDGVRQTEFGLLRRCSEPFPEETQGIQMGGM